jgi:biopolymer transport protein ExbD
MKKINILLFIAIIFISCNPSGDEDLTNNLTLELHTVNTNVSIDEILPITITANKAIMGVDYSLDNFVTSASQFTNFGNSTTVYLNTSKLGKKQVGIKITDTENNTATKTITIIVEKGNAVQLKSLLVNSFYNINQSWDTEFSASDPNRLADVVFVLIKPQIGVFSGQMSQQLWFKSSIKQNQGDLNWNLVSENLYVNPNTILKFSLADDDGAFSQDLMLGPPFERDIDLNYFGTSKPDPINFKDTAINLDVDLKVVW